MRTLISIVLIPLCMLGQCLPHSHTGVSAHSLDDHSSRPHVHLSGGHHHGPNDDHHPHDGPVNLEQEHHHSAFGDDEIDQPCLVQSDSKPCAVIAVPADHDSDAIYFADPSYAVKLAGSVPKVDALDLACGSFSPRVLGGAGVHKRVGHPPDRFASLPIFLTVSSLLL